MSVLSIIFALMILAHEILVLVSLVISVLLFIFTLIALCFKPLRKPVLVVFGSSLAGALLGVFLFSVLSLLFGHNPLSISGWIYLPSAVLGYAGAGLLSAFLYAGIQAVLFPIKYLKRKKQEKREPQI